MYTRLMETIYLSLRAQVVVWTFFMKSPVYARHLHDTADFIKKVLSVYTHSMTTFYLSLGAQVAKNIVMKSPVLKTLNHTDRSLIR